MTTLMWASAIGPVISGVFSLAAVVVAALLRRAVREVHSEVRNEHGTNLRADIDEIMRGQARMHTEIRADIAGLRQDLRQEREERMDLADRIDARCARMHGGLP